MDLEKFGYNVSQNLHDTRNPVKVVKIEYRNTRTNKELLKHLIGPVPISLNMEQLLNSLMQSASKLEQTRSYKNIDLYLKPGDKPDEVNVIYQFKDYSLYFLTASQFYDRNQGIMVQTQAGLRNLFGYYDKIQFQFNKSLQNKKASTYNFQVELPYLGKSKSLEQSNLIFQYQYQTRILNQIVEEGNESFNINFALNQNTSISLEKSLRNNIIKKDLQKYFSNEDFLPSRKTSVKLVKQFFQNIEKNKYNIDTGKSLNGTFECTLPYLGQAQFLKAEINFKNYYIPRRLAYKQYLNRRFKKINIENSINMGFCTPFSKNIKLNLNDCSIGQNIRGFHQLDLAGKYRIQQNPSAVQNNNNSVPYNHNEFYIKNCNKINIYNYPGLKDINTRAFYHFSLGYFYRKINNEWDTQQPFRFQDNIRVSSGIGLSFDIGMNAKAELIYNFFGSGKQKDLFSKLQVRLSIDD